MRRCALTVRVHVHVRESLRASVPVLARVRAQV